MKTMTVSDIGRLCSVGDRTVRRWINQASDKMPELPDKMSEAFAKKRPSRFSLEETIAIVRASGRSLLADLLVENARIASSDHRGTRLPNGKQLEQLRRIYGPVGAARRLDFVLGYSARNEYVSEDEGRRRLKALKDAIDRRQLPLALFFVPNG